MLTKTYTKSIVKPFAIDTKKIAKYLPQKDISESGVIYTLYNIINNKIIIGYSPKIKDINEFLRASKYNLIGERNASKREADLIMYTLSQLGIKGSNKNDYYSYKSLRLLEILNWPTGNLKGKHKKLQSNIN